MAVRRLLLAAACIWAMAAPAAWADHGPPGSDQYNCIDFRFQEDAQGFLNLNAQDFDHLDEDGDGIACERLPRRGAGGGSTNTTVSTTATTVGTTATTMGTTATTVGATATTVATRALVRTGSEDGPLMALSALLVLTGGVLVAVGRRHTRSVQ